MQQPRVVGFVVGDEHRAVPGQEAGGEWVDLNDPGQRPGAKHRGHDLWFIVFAGVAPFAVRASGCCQGRKQDFQNEQIKIRHGSFSLSKERKLLYTFVSAKMPRSSKIKFGMAKKALLKPIESKNGQISSL